MRSQEEILHDISQAESWLEELKNELASSSSPTSTAKQGDEDAVAGPPLLPPSSVHSGRWPFPREEYLRYGRQMIVPEIGLAGQRRIRAAAVLVVGLGGLGCPAARYLAGAGVGRLGLLDGDTVELSNLHRQILHGTAAASTGTAKVASAAASLAAAVDPRHVDVEPLPFHLTPGNALDIFTHYDLILDCTDRPASRYLVSDAAVLAGRPLVSASALRTDGQLIVLNSPPRRVSVGDHTSGLGNRNVVSNDTNDKTTTEQHRPDSGPCYRCIFPKPPPAESVVGCGEGGILGPVVGVMGVLQALEALKLIAAGMIGASTSTSTPTSVSAPAPGPSMLIFSAYGSPPFRSLRMRPRRKDCAACGDAPTVSAESLASGNTDYVAFCGSAAPVDVLGPEQRWDAGKLQRRLQQQHHHQQRQQQHQHTKEHTDEHANGRPLETEQPARPVLIDVRDRTHFELASIPGSVNVPFADFLSGRVVSSAGEDDGQDAADASGAHSEAQVIPDGDAPLLLVCRQGNDSQVAARRLAELGYGRGGRRWIGDLRGGLQAWRRHADPGFPDI